MENTKAKKEKEKCIPLDKIPSTDNLGKRENLRFSKSFIPHNKCGYTLLHPLISTVLRWYTRRNAFRRPRKLLNGSNQKALIAPLKILHFYVKKKYLNNLVSDEL